MKKQAWITVGLFFASTLSLMAEDSVELNPQQARRVKLLALIAENNSRVSTLPEALAKPKKVACEQAVMPLKSQTYDVYVYSLFYPPLHTDAEVPELADLQPLERQLANHTPVLNDFCASTVSASLKRVPNAQDVLDAGAQIRDISSKIQHIVEVDMAKGKSSGAPSATPSPSPEPVLVPEPSASPSPAVGAVPSTEPSVSPAPAVRGTLRCKSSIGDVAETRVMNDDTDAVIHGTDAQGEPLYVATIKAHSNSVLISAVGTLVKAPVGFELDPVELTLPTIAPEESPAVVIRCKVVEAKP